MSCKIEKQDLKKPQIKYSVSLMTFEDIMYINFSIIFIESSCIVRTYLYMLNVVHL